MAVTGPIGVNSDSLFIGADRLGNTPLMFFNGKLDNVRIWGKAKADNLISEQKFLPLEVYSASGIYGNLIASFQLDNSPISFVRGSFMIGNPRNINFINYREKAVNHMDYNGSLVLNGSTDHFTTLNHPDIMLLQQLPLRRG